MSGSSFGYQPLLDEAAEDAPPALQRANESKPVLEDALPAQTVDPLKVTVLHCGTLAAMDASPEGRFLVSCGGDEVRAHRLGLGVTAEATTVHKAIFANTEKLRVTCVKVSPKGDVMVIGLAEYALAAAAWPRPHASSLPLCGSALLTRRAGGVRACAVGRARCSVGARRAPRRRSRCSARSAGCP